MLLTVTLLACLICTPAHAQRNRKSAPAVPAPSAGQLMKDYQFEKAACILQDELDAAQAAGRPTDRLEADLKRANLGMDMLGGTECVIFIDSVKVARKAMLSAIRISPESGRIMPMQEEADKLHNAPATLGWLGYRNQLQDRIIFAAGSKKGAKSLWTSYSVGHTWGASLPLPGLQQAGWDMDSPYMMQDGVTLYFAAQGPESLGGYDLFVTSYNTETKQFRKAENLGMPFNSPANEYLLAIDENARLGWLVTDRNQASDTVCIYVFIPNEVRNTYDADTMDEQELIRLAQLHDIRSTQTNAKAVKEAKARLAALDERPASKTARPHNYVINDGTIYTSLSQFKSPAARRLAQEATKIEDRMTELNEKKSLLEYAVSQGKRTPERIEQLNRIYQELPQLKARYDELAKQWRKAENK